MRRLYLIIVAAILSIGGVVAKEVPSCVAIDIARGVLGQATRGEDVVVAWDSSALIATRHGVEPTFYVITPESGRGFVIVAGDDRVAPILAYSTSDKVASCDMLPENFAAWLRYVDSVVGYVRDNDIAADKATVELWSEAYQPVNATLLNTARWSQFAPYNIYCPMDGDAQSLTGCTQTAMAIIMHYNRWPVRAQGVAEPFTTYTKGIEVPARDLNHSYDWDNMLYEYVEGEYSQAEGEAVAMLMADLGHSFKADYAAESTAALPDGVAMYSNYGYSPSCHYVIRNYYSTESWHELLRSEIEANRPILYSGYTADQEGHAFVIDGVDDNDYFHVNWGWGGVSNGFFRIDGLILDAYLFDTEHWAFLGMHPMRDGEVDNWLYVNAPGMATSAREFNEREPFTIDAISVVNAAVVSFDGDVRVGVCDIRGEFKSWASEAVGFSIDAGYATSVASVVATVEDEIVAGDRLRVYYRSSESDRWFAMLPYADKAQWEILLKQPTIGDTTSLRFDKSTGVITISHDRDVRVELYILGSKVEGGVISMPRYMTIDTSLLSRGDIYTIYLEREDGSESRSYTFKIKDL
ncbi:MAG: hypothetical protein E7146_02050 [Rikenellaceae bacterium]|nr:hypothetical protein [Rikenellaceae bacterium]